VIQKINSQIAVWIDYSNSPAGFDVLEDQIAEQGCFASAALADSIEVMSPISE
jgi:hypothetical protein